MLYRTLLVVQNVLFSCQIHDCIFKIFCPLRHAAALLCQLLRHGDHWRRSLPCMERRYYPRIPWKRKSFIPGTVKSVFFVFVLQNSCCSNGTVFKKRICHLMLWLNLFMNIIYSWSKMLKNFIPPPPPVFPTSGQPVAHLAGDGGGGGVGRRSRLRNLKQKHHDIEDQPHLIITVAFPLLNSMLNLTTTTWHSAASVSRL